MTVNHYSLPANAPGKAADDRRNKEGENEISKTDFLLDLIFFKILGNTDKRADEAAEKN